MRKNVLLAGSSYSALPLLCDLKSCGWKVSVCGNLENDPAVIHADGFHNIDYSVKEELLDLAVREKFDYIVPSCNDFSYLSCAWVADRLGYPGYDSYETAETLHTKVAFRKFALKNGLPVPNGVFSNQISEAELAKLKFPILVKPVDSFSGRGMTKLDNKDRLASAVKRAAEISRTRRFLVEEFVDGTLHSHSAFVRNGKIAADFFVDEYCTVYPYEVNCSCLSMKLSKTIKNKVRQAINEMRSLLKLKDGLIHTQFIVDGSKFWLIESMRRGPGDLYGRLIELSTGIGYYRLLISPFIEKIKFPKKAEPSKQRFFSRHTVSTDRTASVASFGCRLPSKNAFIVSLKASGEGLKAAPYDKWAILFSEFKSRKDLARYTPKLNEYIDIQTYGDSREK